MEYMLDWDELIRWDNWVKSAAKDSMIQVRMVKFCKNWSKYLRFTIQNDGAQLFVRLIVSFARPKLFQWI